MSWLPLRNRQPWSSFENNSMKITFDKNLSRPFFGRISSLPLPLHLEVGDS